jgi:hypothetical protein
LVIGESDLSTRQIDLLILKKLGVPRVYAVNNYPVKNYAESIPLGITNDCDDSPLHRVLANESHFLKANSVDFKTVEFIPSIYINFTAGNNSAVRGKLITMARKLKTHFEVTIETPDFTDQGRIKYLENLRSRGLVLCPEGNGADTHRFWETLYMGGTPVVTTNPMMEFFYSNLPVIQLKSWVELLDINLIEQKWWEIANRSYNFDLLSAEYWINKFSTSEDSRI